MKHKCIEDLIKSIREKFAYLEAYKDNDNSINYHLWFEEGIL